MVAISINSRSESMQLVMKCFSCSSVNLTSSGSLIKNGVSPVVILKYLIKSSASDSSAFLKTIVCPVLSFTSKVSNLIIMSPL